jgi:GTP-binding protein HflX
VHKKIEEVQDVLTQLGITDTPVVYVFNKIDLAKSVPRKTLEKKYKKHTPVFVSSLTGEGMEDLVQKIAEYVGGRAL